MSAVQQLAVDDIEFLQAHEATLSFADGKKVWMEWVREDGLRLQCSGWCVGEVINAARAAERKWKEGQ